MSPIVERRLLTDQAAELLRARIVSGEWEVGAKLPGETTLAAQLGIGRFHYQGSSADSRGPRHARIAARAPGSSYGVRRLRISGPECSKPRRSFTS